MTHDECVKLMVLCGALNDIADDETVSCRDKIFDIENKILEVITKSTVYQDVVKNFPISNKN